MQVNNVQANVNPSFQMAFRIKGIDKAVPGIDMATAKNNFRAYAIQDNLQLAGFKKYNKAQNKLNRYDVEFDTVTKQADVVDTFDGTVKSSHGEAAPGVTGLEHYGVVHFPGRRLFAKLFQQERFLPYNLITAGEEAKALEKAHLKNIKLGDDLSEVLGKNAKDAVENAE